MMLVRMVELAIYTQPFTFLLILFLMAFVRVHTTDVSHLQLYSGALLSGLSGLRPCILVHFGPSLSGPAFSTPLLNFSIIAFPKFSRSAFVDAASEMPYGISSFEMKSTVKN